VPILPARSPILSVALSTLEASDGGRDVRSADEFNEVRQFIAAGMNDCAISRKTGIPRPTVRDWRCRPQVLARMPAGSVACGCDHDFAVLPAAPYSYLLGLYLGDGCISRIRRVWRLRIVLDTKYPSIIERCREAIDMRSSPGTWCARSSCDSSISWFRRSVPLGWPPVLTMRSGLLGIC
jgi:hypothetical protein